MLRFDRLVIATEVRRRLDSVGFRRRDDPRIECCLLQQGRNRIISSLKAPEQFVELRCICGGHRRNGVIGGQQLRRLGFGHVENQNRDRLIGDRLGPEVTVYQFEAAIGQFPSQGCPSEADLGEQSLEGAQVIRETLILPAA